MPVAYFKIIHMKRDKNRHKDSFGEVGQQPGETGPNIELG
jgi:hypothetical protein